MKDDDRDQFLSDRGVPLPKASGTDTTIVRCLVKGVFIFGKDTRATEGPLVATRTVERCVPQSTVRRHL